MSGDPTFGDAVTAVNRNAEMRVLSFMAFFGTIVLVVLRVAGTIGWAWWWLVSPFFGAWVYKLLMAAVGLRIARTWLRRYGPL